MPDTPITPGCAAQAARPGDFSHPIGHLHAEICLSLRMESTKKNAVKQDNQLSGGLIKHEAIDGREALPIDIESLIYVIREQQVMLDSDLSRLYGVETKVLNQAVKRNIQRFPADFVFQLTKDECLRSQIVTSNGGRGGLRYMPYAFTENGVAMLSSVLRSERAIEVNIRIMRAFS